MITSDSFRNELVTLSIDTDLPTHAVRLFNYFMGTYTYEWQEYDLEVISKKMEISKTTLYRALKGLVKKGYVEKTQTAKNLTRIKIQSLNFKSEIENFKSEIETAPIRNIKRERVYIFVLFNIIFWILNKNIFSSLSDIPYRENKISDLKSSNFRSEIFTEQIYSLAEEFYQQLQEIGIRVNDKLKAQLDYVGAEKVTEIYDRIIWDAAIRKPSTIFLKELGKAVNEKRKVESENRRQASNYRTWAGSRELSLQQIYQEYKSYKNLSKEQIIKLWRDKSTFFGYTEHEIDLFKKEVIEKEIEEGENSMEE